MKRPQCTVELLGQELTIRTPALEQHAILPGGTRWGFLAGLMPEVLLDGSTLATMEEVRAFRRAGQPQNYTWNLFLREVNHISTPNAHKRAHQLLDRDIGFEMRPGGMFANISTNGLQARTGATSLEALLVPWLRIANRYAWHRRFLAEVPDPFFDPIPPLIFTHVQDRYQRHVQPYVRETFHARGLSRALDVVCAAILYVFGYLAERPGFADEATWSRAVTGLFGPHKPLYHMLSVPGDYLNYLAMEEQSGVAGFFPTPIAVTTFMGALVSPSPAIDPLDEAMTNAWPGDTPEARKARLLARVSDPCVGTGNMLAHLMNTHVLGEFIDINPSMVLATRALCAMYAPWFTHSVFQADALASSGPALREQQVEQLRVYLRDELRARAGFLYHGAAQAKAAESGADAGAVDRAALARVRAQARRYSTATARGQPFAAWHRQADHDAPASRNPKTGAPGRGTPTQLNFFGGETNESVPA